ncbi:permease [Halogeometricum borinquense]|uniref:DUF7344 domain-containing protein n=2 Tax=Halogeometricum borinquense TaxID=60847 RepID=E4NRZ0_HALBP|nr:helix-turn-helix transcriptional regulator [Halogeometricum borinquense]ADQ68036.1 hypothetical protein Hbor_24800 [Halogeometricum borinquense DSM 11551]ELY24406.1 hypothetical protein C499_16047 [Halogeometricum borinquense DSM 11551]QIB73362.1 permease [Halogeometricum borinquense]QIQ77240.1 permease [Halogeometricum borinquense]RYJ13048.1 permease [Halogeometricum borinquense]
MDGNSEQFRLLSQRRRLVVLSVLRERDEPTTLDELATEVGVRELDVPREELTDEQRNRILFSFHHVHIPKLIDADLVEYASSDEESVRLTDEMESVERILDIVFDD